MKKDIRSTLEGSLIASVTIVLEFIAIYVPILGLLAELFGALPLAILTARHGIIKGISAIGVILILMTILMSPLISLRFVLSFGVCGIVLGSCARQNFKPGKIFLATLLSSIVGQLLLVTMLLFIMDINLVETQLKMIQESFEETFKFYETFGIEPQRIDETRKQLKPTMQLLTFIIPSLFLLTSIVNTLTTFLSAQWIFPKLQLEFPKISSFAEWKFPSIFFYLSCFGLIGLYWGVTRNFTNLYGIAINMLFMSSIVGLIEGISLLSFFLDRYKILKIFRIIFYLSLLLNAVLLQILIILGLLDTLFDYRKRLKKK